MKLKRILGVLTSAVCTLTICAASLTLTVSADKTGETGGMTYSSNGSSVTITGFTDKSATSFVIPQDVLNLPVTAIANNAFADNTAITQVSIPESVTSIGDKAFYGCSNLASVSIPSSVTSVGARAFNGTYIVNQQDGPVRYVSNWAVQSDNATAVEIKNGTTGIADDTFNFYGDYTSLETVQIPGTVQTIGDGAFAGNTAIRTLTIPSGVKTIGDYAFNGCEHILKLSIASSVTRIGAYAFANCDTLDNIKIPESVTSIGKDAFLYTSEYNKQEGPEFYIGSWIVDCLDSQENVSINVKSGTKGIADGAFEDMHYIKSVSIASGTVTIGARAFANCDNISQLQLPETITTIGDYAFANASIPNIVIPSSVTSIGNSAFSGCTNMTDITIKNPSCTIGNYAIYSGTKMHVIENSTAYDYAKQNGNQYDYETGTITPNPGPSTDPDVKLGDINRNGSYDLQDVIAICRHLLGTKSLTIEEQKVADYSGNGKVDLYDAIGIAKEMLKK